MRRARRFSIVAAGETACGNPASEAYGDGTRPPRGILPQPPYRPVGVVGALVQQIPRGRVARRGDRSTCGSAVCAAVLRIVTDLGLPSLRKRSRCPSAGERHVREPVRRIVRVVDLGPTGGIVPRGAPAHGVVGIRRDDLALVRICCFRHQVMDQQGWNLRHDVCHGITPSEGFTMT